MTSATRECESAYKKGVVMRDLLDWLYVYKSLTEDGELDDEAEKLLDDILEKMEGLLTE